MLKKAGIVVAAVATTMLVLSPLAFAAGSPESKNHTEQAPQPAPPGGGLIDLHGLDVLSNLNVCPDVNVAVPVGNVLGILGLGSATATQADAPINCTTSDSHS